jgi:hypothetical protein
MTYRSRGRSLVEMILVRSLDNLGGDWNVLDDEILKLMIDSDYGDFHMQYVREVL